MSLYKCGVRFFASIILLGMFNVYVSPLFEKYSDYPPAQRNRLYAMDGGRLGNHLFNLAGTFGVAKTNDRQLVIPLDFACRIMKFLNMTFLPAEFSFAPSWVPVRNVKYATYQNKMEHLEGEDLKLGYFVQSFKYFQQYTSAVKNMMVIKNDLVNKTQSFLQSIDCTQKANCTFIAVHMRRGDLLLKNNIRIGYVLAKPKYLEKAMMYFLSKYTNVHFIVSSDDIKWCKTNETNLQPGGLKTTIKYSVHFSPSYSPEFDLALLAQCNHTIMTVGTFGWWGGWLAGGEVTYFNNPIRKGSPLSYSFTANDYFWPTWIGIGDN